MASCFVSSLNQFTTIMISLLYVTNANNSNRRRYCVQMVALVICIIHYYNSIHECKYKYLLREAILRPNLLPWCRLMDYGDLSSFLLMTGLTWEAFNSRNGIVLPPGHQSLGNKKGCKWSLPPDAQLGILFFHLGSTMQCMHLCMLFEIMPSACSRILNNMLKIAIRRLQNHPLA